MALCSPIDLHRHGQCVSQQHYRFVCRRHLSRSLVTDSKPHQYLLKVKKELATQKAGKAIKGAIQKAETWGESISGFFEKLEHSLGTALGVILLIVVFVTIAYIIGKCKKNKPEVIEKQPPYNPNYSEEKAINALDRLSEVLEEKEKAKKKKERLEIELMNEVD